MSRTPTHHRASACVMLVALLAASCGGSRNDTEESPASQAPTNRLAVIDTNGNLVTMKPDGTDVRTLEEAAFAGQISQPTWSPDGQRVAWASVSTSDGESSQAIITSRFDGTGRTRHPTTFAPFYLYWDPTSSRIAYLGSGTSGLELGIAEAEQDGIPGRVLDTGQPYYISWGPDGDRLLIHVGTDRLGQLALDGSLARASERPGAFQAPVWSIDGTSLLFATRDDVRQQLILTDTDGTNRRRLLDFAGFISFSLSPDGRRVAFQINGSGTTDSTGVVAGGGPGVGAAAPAIMTPALAQAFPDVLSVLDVESGEITALDPDSLGFFWSPNSDRLLSLHADPDDTSWLRWVVWDGDEIRQSARLRLSTIFATSYMPFFSQFAQSMTLWAPDSSAFSYPAVNEAGESGIWVQDGALAGSPVLVSGGLVVAWSPR